MCDIALYFKMLLFTGKESERRNNMRYGEALGHSMWAIGYEITVILAVDNVLTTANH